MASSEARLILASASPRRAALLRALGVSFRVVASGVDESLLAGEDGVAAAERLARRKAAAVTETGGLAVLAADTVVLCDGAVLGKPESPEDAARMLRLLSGRTHEVVTGVALAAGGELRSGIERTAVRFGALSDAQIAWYVSTNEPLDKAGAYHIDGGAAAFIESLSGSPSNVAGLPVRLVLSLARDAGLTLGPP
ncbi:MAG: Maf family protein [Vicinamibacteria bacterium]